jgi:succinoglycan biosynthesis protein ExoM
MTEQLSRADDGGDVDIGRPDRSNAVRRPHVAITACTVDRPDGLRHLLDGLSRLTFVRTPEPQITIVIIDNSSHGQAEDIVAAHRALLRWPIVYRHEPRRGLVHARNAQLDAAPASADWLAMIDDDETPVPQWLESLLAVAHEHDAQLVGGPVTPAYVERPPAWVVQSGFYEIAPVADGTPIERLYTNNALVSLDAVRRHGWRFDMAFNVTGGEDEHFFSRAIAAGLKAVSAHDAEVIETVQPGRATLAWLLRRFFRNGTTHTTMDRLRDPSAKTAITRALKGGARIVFGLVTMLAVTTRGRLALVQGLSQLSQGAGALAGLLGFRYNEYRAISRPAPGSIVRQKTATDQ